MDKIKAALPKIKEKIKSLAQSLKQLPGFLNYIFKDFISFNVLVLFYVIDTLLIKRLTKILPYSVTSTVLAQFYRLFGKLEKKLDASDDATIPKIDLIKLAIRNMQVKKTRTLITIGGVAIGIGAIVFLVSLGYGLQELVISRVARLDELKQADVATQPGSKVRIDDKTLSDVKQFPNVFEVYPLIAVVGRVNFQNSITDMAVYGVTSGYLERSAIKPTEGKIFDSNETSFLSEEKPLSYTTKDYGSVAGISVSNTVDKGDKVGTLEYDILPDTWIRVRGGPGAENEILGYTKHTEYKQTGDIYLGTEYEGSDKGSSQTTSSGENLGEWIRSDVLLWQETENGYEPIIDEVTNEQSKRSGYFSMLNIIVNTANYAIDTDVLAETDTRDTETSTTEATTTTLQPDAEVDPLSALEIDPNSEWVALSDETETEANELTKVMLSDKAIRQAVVNRAMIKILGLDEKNAVGKTFMASFVLPSYLIEGSSKRVESEPSEYTIVGVTPDDTSPVFYVPFIDLRSLGIVNFSQFKVMSQTPESLADIRKKIESIGYNTTSVVDTVTQINSLFGTIRLVLGVMGMIALAVASLGMFNTLTVSLLERSREVGLMKAMGMKTSEVQELFLTESMIMGFCAGLSGLLLGWLGGKGVGLLLSSFSMFKGQGYIDVSKIPGSFIFVILLLSLFVGVFTGIYPAKRSKKISALDALRYE